MINSKDAKIGRILSSCIIVLRRIISIIAPDSLGSTNIYIKNRGEGCAYVDVQYG
jgi:hypothetical protein